MNSGVETPDPQRDEIVGVFLDESDEALAEVDSHLVALEADPHDLERINSVFRAFHSIKGNSSFFGFMKVKQLAHQLEDVLALMRGGELTVTQRIMDGLLAGVDQLKDILARVRANQSEWPEQDKGQLAQLIERLAALCEPPDEQVADRWPGVFRQLDELTSSAKADAQLARALVNLREDLVALAPDVLCGEHPTPGGADPRSELEGLLAESFTDQLPDTKARAVGELLTRLRDAATGASRDLLENALTEYAAMMESVGFVPMLQCVLQEKLEMLRKLELEDAVASSPTPAPAQPREQPAPAAADAASRTMRVEESKIDEFLSYVGELIMVREMFANVGKRLRDDNTQNQISSEHQRALGAFTALSHDLQHSIMEVRKIPVRAILQKVPRMARDLAAACDKEVQVEIVGAEIAVDKSLVEGFEAPIMHMVRNALDHGIEPPDEREREGKSRCGTIRVTASEWPDEICFAIEDDGRGIDHAAIRAKAVRSGILTESAAHSLSERRTTELLFAPGLSTAKQVTEVSGRGVGMDVVKRNVDELGGTIEVDSELGRGSSFRVHLPKTVTVQILDGFLVQVGLERFVLPLQSINESFRPASDEIHSIVGRGECIARAGKILPLVRFADVLHLPGARGAPTEAIVVSIDVKGGGVAGIMVDDVLGTQQIVLRDVDGIDTRRVPFSGGAVLGDGRVAMVVDVERLAALMA